MNDLLDLAEKNGYKKALVEMYEKLKDDTSISRAVKKLLTPSHFETYILDESRSKFTEIINLPKNASVLDLGCGWGAVSISFAKKLQKTGGKIYGVDATKETLAFIKTRAKQERLNNIELAAAEPFDYGQLPFEDNSLDLVILNGVLEWIGMGRRDISPRECQKNALNEINRILKPGGQLYIGIENAAAYEYYLGQKDHSGIRFVGAFPKWLADLTSRIVKKEPYRTYIYSPNGYKKILQETDFAAPVFKIPVPSYRNIEEIVDYTDADAKKAFAKYWKKSGIKGSRMKHKIMKFLLSLPGARKHVYSYSILTYKPK
jgi:ubiquinone/menaquinone biosynthesis C-methylase UbiE